MKALGLRIYSGLASLKLTIGVLSLLAAALIAGTFYESANGTPMAHRTFYASRWFDAILLLLAINMMACTAKRYPYKPHQLGFLTVHCGILTILTGAFLTRNFGREGELFLMEGETRDFMSTARPFLRLRSPGDGVASWEMPVVFPAKATGAEVDRVVQVPRSDLRLRFGRYFPNAHWDNTVVASDSANPALRVRVAQKDRSEETWLLPRHPGRDVWDGPVRIETVEVGSDAEAEAVVAQLDAEQPRSRGTLHLALGTAPLTDIALDGPLPRSVTAGDYEIRLREWFPHFVFDGQRPGNASDAMVNPALLFDLRGPKGVESHIVFALHSFRTLVSPEMDRGYDVRASYDLPAATGEPVVRIVRSPDGVWRIGANVPLDVGADPRVEIGRAYRGGATGVELTVTQTLDRARAHSELVNVDREERNPAVWVQVLRGDVASPPLWVVFGDTKTVRVGEHDVTLELGRRQLPLGFDVQLVDFRETTYPGTNRSATFASDVLVTDRGMAAVPVHIAMNQPLKHNGFRLFQSSYVRDGGREASIFSVTYDPGVSVVYTGFIIFIFGLVAIFYLKPLIRRAYARPLPGPRPAIRPVPVERTSS